MEQATAILQTTAELAGNIADILDAFESKGKMLKSMKILQFAGPIGGILQCVSVFLPKQPSAEEKAIEAALETITKKMDEQHKETMGELSKLGRNQFMIYNNDKVKMLE